MPACCALVDGGGTVPNPPPRLVDGVAFEALPQPASAVTPATASAAITVTRTRESGHRSRFPPGGNGLVGASAWPFGLALGEA